MTPIAPAIRSLTTTGTQMNVISERDRRTTPVRSRKSGSWLTCGTTTGFPVSTTRPMMPSPTLYRVRRAISPLSPVEASIASSPPLSESSATLPLMAPWRSSRISSTRVRAERGLRVEPSVWLISSRSDSFFTSSVVVFSYVVREWAAAWILQKRA